MGVILSYHDEVITLECFAALLNLFVCLSAQHPVSLAVLSILKNAFIKMSLQKDLTLTTHAG